MYAFRSNLKVLCRRISKRHHVEWREDHIHRIVVIYVLDRVLVFADILGVSNFTDGPHHFVIATHPRRIAMQTDQFSVEHPVSSVVQCLDEGWDRNDETNPTGKERGDGSACSRYQQYRNIPIFAGFEIRRFNA